MLRLSDNFRYFFCHESVNLKYRHNGLGCYVKNELHRDPLNGGKIYDYLCDVLGRIDNHIGSLVDLLPHKWKPMSLALSY